MAASIGRFFNTGPFFFSSRRRHTRCSRDWSSECALPISWVAVKPTGAKSYTVYEVIGWRLRWGDTVLVVRDRAPDERWFGSFPEILADRRGPGVDDLIQRVEAAARDYPYSGEYRLWPGPNSNTFTASIGRAVPELEMEDRKSTRLNSSHGY